MRLEGSQAKQLLDALLDAYRTRTDLDRMVRFELNENLDDIAADKNFTDAVYSLIKWAEAHEHIDHLVMGARKDKPKNYVLSRFHFQFASSGLVKDENLPDLPKKPKRIGLTYEQEQKFLAEHRKWTLMESESKTAWDGVQRELYRVYEFPSFELAFQYMQEVAEKGIEPNNHHPRWQNTYNRVEVWLTTFNCGSKPSTKDVQLAQVFDEIWVEFKKNRF